jgi:hypothetical protein
MLDLERDKMRLEVSITILQEQALDLSDSEYLRLIENITNIRKRLRFFQHLNDSSRRIKDWPQWKQNVIKEGISSIDRAQNINII